MLLQLGDELEQVRRVCFVERRAARCAFYSEPKVLTPHNSPHARERESAKAQSLAATRTHHVNLSGRERDDAFNERAGRLLRGTKYARSVRVQQLFESGRAELSQRASLFVNFKERDDGAQALAQKRQSLDERGCEFRRRDEPEFRRARRASLFSEARVPKERRREKTLRDFRACG